MTHDSADLSLMLRPSAAAKLLGVSVPTLYRWVKNGTFPAPRRLGPRVSAWLRREIEEYLESLPAIDEPETVARHDDDAHLSR